MAELDNRISKELMALVQGFNQRLDHANHLADVRRTLRTKIESRIAFLKISHDQPHDGSVAAWLKRLDEDSQVNCLRWVLEELEKE